MISGNKKQNSVRLIANSTEIEEISVVLLGMAIDNLFTFNEHIDVVPLSYLCRTANYKPHASRRIRKYLSLEKAEFLCNEFINSQFNYAPLAWIFFRKKQYWKIQKIHHKALNSNNKYDKRFRDSNQISIHQRHLHGLICKVFKSLNNLNPEFM